MTREWNAYHFAGYMHMLRDGSPVPPDGHALIWRGERQEKST